VIMIHIKLLLVSLPSTQKKMVQQPSQGANEKLKA